MMTLATEITSAEADALTIAAQLDKGKQLPLEVRKALRRHLQPLEEEARRGRLDMVAASALRRTVLRTMAASGAAYALWDVPTWTTAARGARSHFPAVLGVAQSLGC